MLGVADWLIFGLINAPDRCKMEFECWALRKLALFLILPRSDKLRLNCAHPSVTASSRSRFSIATIKASISAAVRYIWQV